MPVDREPADRAARAHARAAAAGCGALLLVGALVFGGGLRDAPSAHAEEPARAFEAYRLGLAKERGQRWLMAERDPISGGWPEECGGRPDVGTTAAVVLSLLADGHTPHHGRYAAEVRSGLAFILDAVRRLKPSGLAAGNSVLQSELGSPIHAYLGALALGEALGMQADGSLRQRSNEREMRAALAELCRYIEATQDSTGSWRASGRAPIFATTTAFLAMRSARASGIAVDSGSLTRLLGYLERIYDRSSGKFESGMNAGIELYDTCNALRILYGLGEHEGPMGRSATAKLFDHVKTRFTTDSIGGEEFLCWWYVTSTLVHEDGPLFHRWYGLVTDKLLLLQNADGSWTGHGCINGRVFCTAAALLTIETPRRYLPMDSL